MTTLLAMDLAGRDVLVAGGGPAAARRVRPLVADGATVLVVAPELCEDLADLCRDGRIRWRRGAVAPGDLAGMWLVHTATGDRSTDRLVSAWAEQRGTWCSTDSPETGGSAEHLRSGRISLRDTVRRPGGDGRVVLVGGGPGDLDLLTLRGWRALAAADVVVVDRLGPTAVLDELGPDVEVVGVGKAPGNHPVPQHEINQILVERAQRGQRVVRLKGGDPFVFGRGGEEVLACREAGVRVDVVPGVSSAVAVPAAAGIPLTHRGVVGAVHVVNGHDELSDAACAAIRDRSATVVVLMGVATLGATTARALAAGADPTTPVAVIERGCTPEQRVTWSILGRVALVAVDRGVTSPAVIVIGAVAAAGLLGVVPETHPLTRVSP